VFGASTDCGCPDEDPCACRGECGCTPTTSCAASGACGWLYDGCAWQYCGDCCTPTTGCSAGMCGTIWDGCEYVDCGGCDGYPTDAWSCGGGGTDNVCGCAGSCVYFGPHCGGTDQCGAPCDNSDDVCGESSYAYTNACGNYCPATTYGYCDGVYSNENWQWYSCYDWAWYCNYYGGWWYDPWGCEEASQCCDPYGY
jgi:hypothetical protein